MSKEKLTVTANDVPSLGEQHFSCKTDLKHINDPELKQTIIECDDEDEPVSFINSDTIANHTGLGGPKTRFLLSGLSVDETKLSALILCLILAMVFSGITYVFNGDISNNLTSIITTLIYAIAGVNITNSVINRINFPSNESMSVHTNSKKNS